MKYLLLICDFLAYPKAGHASQAKSHEKLSTKLLDHLVRRKKANKGIM